MMQDKALGGVSDVLRPPGQSEGRTAPCMLRKITASAAAREGVRTRKSSTMRSMTGCRLLRLALPCELRRWDKPDICEKPVGVATTLPLSAQAGHLYSAMKSASWGYARNMHGCQISFELLHPIHHNQAGAEAAFTMPKSCNLEGLKSCVEARWERHATSIIGIRHCTCSLRQVSHARGTSGGRLHGVAMRLLRQQRHEVCALQVAQEYAAQQGGDCRPLQRHHSSRLRKPGNPALGSFGVQLADSFGTVFTSIHDSDGLKLCEMEHECRSLMVS